MNIITISWIGLPFFVGFVIFLLPQLDKYLAMFAALASAVYAFQLFALPAPVKLELLNHFGVTLAVDQLSAYFILTNALVTVAVILYCWHSGKTAFFYAQTIIVHGSLNAAFASTDFISLYVALEVSGIAAFLLIAYPRTDRSIWVALRYLFVSNTAMLFYLVGAVLAYQTSHTFAFAGLRGIVVKAGVYPLVKCALMVEHIDPIVRVFGVGTALLGVFYAVFEKDAKRMLAFHTVSQLGFILAAPEVGGFYALTHGLVKSSLFLIAGALPSRNLKDLQYKPIDSRIWMALAIASFSISGFPMLSGFGAKVLTMKNLVPWQVIGMNVAALGTAISFAKFIFLPRGGEQHQAKPGFWPATIILLVGLFVANFIYYDAYNIGNIAKPLVTIALGWWAYGLFFQKSVLKLPRMLEQFEHLIGFMSLCLMLLFWMALGSTNLQ